MKSIPLIADAIRLPIPYHELLQVSDDFLEKGAPLLRAYLAQNLGWRIPALTKRKKTALSPRIKSELLGIRGYLIAQQILAGEISRSLAAYAVWEGQARKWMRLGDTKRHPDALQTIRRRLAEAARPTETQIALPGYVEIRGAIDVLAGHAAERFRDEDFRAYFWSWFSLTEARTVLHFLQRMKSAVKSWRSAKPKRLTQHLITQLVSEYRELATIFELQIPRMIGIASAIDGIPAPWPSLYGPPLVKKLATAQGSQTHPELGTIADVIRRDVRNAMAHGGPVYDVLKRTVEFQSRGRTVASWSAEEFYTETKRLWSSVLAMYQFDDQLQHLAHERLLAVYADAIRAEASPKLPATPQLGAYPCAHAATTRCRNSTPAIWCSQLTAECAPSIT